MLISLVFNLFLANLHEYITYNRKHFFVFHMQGAHFVGWGPTTTNRRGGASLLSFRLRFLSSTFNCHRLFV